MKIKALSILAITALFTACGSDSEEHVDVVDNEQDTATVANNTDESLEYVIPSAFRIAMSFNRVGLEYQEGVTNPPENLNRYQSSIMAHLNFGTYSADMSYCVLNGEEEKSLAYLEAVLKLSENVGLSSIFGSEQLINDFKDNFGDEEVMSDILTTIEDDMNMFLEDENNEFTHGLIFCGAWIESVYIGSQVLSDNEYVSKKLIDEMKSLNAIIGTLKKNPNNMEGMDDLLADLESIRNIYQGFANYSQIEDAEDWDGIVFSVEEINALTNKVVELRNKIIAG